MLGILLSLEHVSLAYDDIDVSPKSISAGGKLRYGFGQFSYRRSEKRRRGVMNRAASETRFRLDSLTGFRMIGDRSTGWVAESASE
jgi:hypothetical protein